MTTQLQSRLQLRVFRWGALATIVLVLLFSGCDSAAPVAPPGTLLSLTANPARITTDGVSQIRATARKPNGTPVSEGTLILFGTTVGQITPSVPVDASGDAVTLLRGSGEFGMAEVTASTGGAESAMVEVQVGLSATSISLQATPSSVGETGGKVNLAALVRDDQGRALSGAQVNFQSDSGALSSGGGVVETGSDGVASDVLTLSSGDLGAIQGDTFQVAVEVGSGSGSLVTATDTITILRLPKADFTFGTNNLSVAFTDTSTGRPTKWSWTFGDGNTSTLQNPTHTYSAMGTYAVSLTPENTQGSDSITKFVSVTGQ